MEAECNSSAVQAISWPLPCGLIYHRFSSSVSRRPMKIVPTSVVGQIPNWDKKIK